MKLARWLEDRGITRQAFAARIGVTAGTITGYCDGSIWPKRENMERIALATDGDVTANDFLQNDHADAPPVSVSAAP